MVMLILPVSAFSEGYKSGYMGEENRKIKSHSPDDIGELKNGAGWGFVKAADLHGVFRLVYIFEMKDKKDKKDKVNLFDEQTMKIQRVYNDMRIKADNLRLLCTRENFYMRFKEVILTSVLFVFSYSHSAMVAVGNVGHMSIEQW